MPLSLLPFSSTLAVAVIVVFSSGYKYSLRPLMSFICMEGSKWHDILLPGPEIKHNEYSIKKYNSIYVMSYHIFKNLISHYIINFISITTASTMIL